jgi:two-component system LytT family response regulator
MDKKLTAIIVDDETLAREIIKKYLGKYSQIDLLAECSNGFEGFKQINELKPDILFLDVQMPKLTGFEMLEILDNIPSVIFTTAYDQYAIKAFEVNAVDYLLKPYSEARFDEAITKLLIKLSAKQNEPIQNIQETFRYYPNISKG